MVWKEAFPPANEVTLDAETERERRLAAQARAGAEWALTALIARYQPAVIRYLTRLCGNPAQARELGERIFQRMERRLHGPHGGENLRLWLLRACTEAGLDVLRRPQRARAPRLGMTIVAGLLPQQGATEGAGRLKGGLNRLRKAVDAASRQRNPLIWSGHQDAAKQRGKRPEEMTTESDAKNTVSHPVDEELDTLDPRDAVRHRLMRVTLAELPYGDAQCLALHLVAGLNQAEVARALGITGSAARARIVQGLKLFAERYATAVDSLGLPPELGYGDAAPRIQTQEEPALAAPEQTPVIVPALADDVEDLGLPTGAANPQPLNDNDVFSRETSYDEDVTVEGPYISTVESDFDSPLAYETAAASLWPGQLASTDTNPMSAHVAVTVETKVETKVETRVETDMDVMTGQHNDDEDGYDSGAGIVTRLATDAIIGPVVDALPVAADVPALAPGFGAPSPRSTPLAYELDSGESADSSGVTMNLIHSTGSMVPLTFEAIAKPTETSGETLASHEHWAQPAALSLEASAELDSDIGPRPLAPEEDPHVTVINLTVDAHDDETPQDEGVTANSDFSLGDADAAALSLMPDTSPETAESVPEEAPLLEDMGALDETPFVVDELYEARPGVATRTLEDLWDESSDSIDQ